MYNIHVASLYPVDLTWSMPSYAPRRVLRGTHWNYRIIDTVSGDNTHTSFAFKAEVIPLENTLNIPRWAFIKGAPVSDVTAMENLDRECRSYRIPGVASAACFRRMCDVIDTHDSEMYIALEWLDTTLAQLKYLPNMRTYAIIATFLNAVLESCVVLEIQKYVNTGMYYLVLKSGHPPTSLDYKPVNILLSSIATAVITAKVGDLGLVFPADHRYEAQPYAMRAPKAVAAMLLCWIKPGVLGAWDSPHFLINTAWSMAKIKRLFPSPSSSILEANSSNLTLSATADPSFATTTTTTTATRTAILAPKWNIPTPDEVEGESFKAAVRSARRMSQEEPGLQAILPLEEEIRGVDMPQQLSDLLCLMLVVDPSERPSASSVLALKEFRAFQTFSGQRSEGSSPGSLRGGSPKPSSK
ncbi:hypothetical protein BKA61DRAFT_656843 [Leptodontidium sp. MPI-SDFR-AT-0119]|nr:hypothetical protein BKA61DRAFT_656843 [Leptodontidium sp. MPI-SDFR-AT-0119]